MYLKIKYKMTEFNTDILNKINNSFNITKNYINDLDNSFNNNNNNLNYLYLNDSKYLYNQYNMSNNSNIMSEYKFFNFLKLYIKCDTLNNAEDININLSSNVCKNKINKFNLEHAYIKGIFYEHPTSAVYNFNACELTIYIPELDLLYNGKSCSLECYNKSIKWNNNYYIKIRQAVSNDYKNNNNLFRFNLKEETVEDEGGLMETIENYFEIYTNISNNNNIVLNSNIDNFNECLLFKIKVDKINNSNIKDYYLNSIINLFISEKKNAKNNHIQLSNKLIANNDLKKELLNITNDINCKLSNFNNNMDEIIIKGMLLIEEKEKYIKSLIKEGIINNEDVENAEKDYELILKEEKTKYNNNITKNKEDSDLSSFGLN